MLRFLLASLLLAPVCFAIDDYQLGPDSLARHDGVPKGRVEKFEWTSKVFPGTVRDCWVYIPAQYDGKKPAALMMFQDGGGYQSETGQWRVPIVFDNLIAAKQMPVTIGLFANPGNDPVKNPPPKPGEKPAKPFRPNNRGFEYDTLSDQYATFLIDELIPEATKRFELNVTKDPEGHAIAGSSSGGICSFTVAWNRADQFRKVFSTVGSFTAIAYRPAAEGKCMQPGGDLYPALIRRNPIKPIRIFLQDGSNDLDNEFGNWFLANQQMLSAFNYANTKADKANTPGPRYDVNHVWGDGGHNGKHGGSIFPDAMRWLWRDYPKD
jgi:enterochelin esterase family protein